MFVNVFLNKKRKWFWLQFFVIFLELILFSKLYFTATTILIFVLFIFRFFFLLFFQFLVIFRELLVLCARPVVYGTLPQCCIVQHLCYHQLQ